MELSENKRRGSPDKCTPSNKLCVHPFLTSPLCGSWWAGWKCTREPHHEGWHVACGSGKHNLASWNKSKTLSYERGYKGTYVNGDFLPDKSILLVYTNN